MKLEKYKEEAQFFTSKVSDLNRYLGFVGIAVVWIFKTEVDGKIIIPYELFMPLVLFVISLVVDFLQYIYGATVWTIFFRYHENQKKKNPSKRIYQQDDIKSPKILPNLTYYCFFYPKVIINIIGYGFLISFILQAIKN